MKIRQNDAVAYDLLGRHGGWRIVCGRYVWTYGLFPWRWPWGLLPWRWFGYWQLVPLDDGPTYADKSGPG